MSDSDDEAPINVKPKTEKFIPPTAQPISEHMERVFDPEEEYYFLRPKPQTESKLKVASTLVSQNERKSKGASHPQTESIPKDNTKDIIKSKHITEPKTKTEDSIYSKIKYERKKCHAEFKNKITLNTHSYSHNCKYLENTE